ncbi:Sec-independent protein translocase protein TatB [Corynebacterium terpenotabidum]|uniref:Sec-independent protein translocase protein TatB n=1 Tax=Corynebacterium terpenotabidum Y-11 TaxID=1200352 RepID=S4XDC9_9CORY|nr:Sec-independent protein translocase protein TatB [Corynebacterium terpenotabidum]AGP31157.1 sec-independent translocase [Corynebacterium terpenotabidum Y-11]
MFSSVGWGEILVLVIVGLIVVGPERLPRIITDVKAMILAARNAISSAKAELGDGFAEDFEEFRKPLSQLNDVRRMGARGLVTKALLDDDPEFLGDLEKSARSVTDSVTGTGGQAAQTAKPTSSPNGTAASPSGPSTPGPDASPTTPAAPGGPDTSTDRPGWATMDDGDVL